MNSEIINIKNRIIEENKNNQSKRRKFSKKIEGDIVQFINEYKLSSNNAAQLIGIGLTTIEKWKARNKKKFTKIKVQAPLKQNTKKDYKISNTNSIRMNQIFLIILTIVLIIEVLFFHLSDWHNGKDFQASHHSLNDGPSH